MCCSHATRIASHLQLVLEPPRTIAREPNMRTEFIDRFDRRLASYQCIILLCSSMSHFQLLGPLSTGCHKYIFSLPTIKSPICALESPTHILCISAADRSGYRLPPGVTRSRITNLYSFASAASIVDSVRPAGNSIFSSRSCALYGVRTATCFLVAPVLKRRLTVARTTCRWLRLAHEYPFLYRYRTLWGTLMKMECLTQRSDTLPRKNLFQMAFSGLFATVGLSVNWSS